MQRPELRRGVQATPYQHQGQPLVIMSDPRGLAEDYAAPLPAYLMMILMDGQRTPEDLSRAFHREYRQVFPSSLLDELITHLDESHWLDNERSQAALADLERAFLAAPVRPARHAGAAYPAEPEALRSQLEAYFAEGPGGAPQAGRQPGVAGVLAPHIDVRCGGTTLAHAFHALAEGEPFDRVVILGIGHFALVDAPFIVTRKAFESPLGRLETDTEFIDRLEAACGPSIYEGEIAHEREHSIEFQTIFLQHVLGDRQVPIVPILCGSLHEHIAGRSSPAGEARVSRFLDALRETAAQMPGRTAYVAGVDFSHIGLKFGHERVADEAYLAETRERDHELLGHVESGDAEAFWASVARDGNASNVCGYPAIYSMLKVLGPGEGTVLHYEANVEQPTQSAVSYAAVSYRV